MQYLVDDQDLTSVADSIRSKGGTVELLDFPEGYSEAIENLPSGGGAMWVNFYEDDGTFYCDTEAEDIINAHESGLIVCGKFGSDIYRNDYIDIDYGIAFSLALIDGNGTVGQEFHAMGSYFYYDFNDNEWHFSSGGAWVFGHDTVGSALIHFGYGNVRRIGGYGYDSYDSIYWDGYVEDRVNFTIELDQETSVTFVKMDENVLALSAVLGKKAMETLREYNYGGFYSSEQELDFNQWYEKWPSDWIISDGIVCMSLIYLSAIAGDYSDVVGLPDFVVPEDGTYVGLCRFSSGVYSSEYYLNFVGEETQKISRRFIPGALPEPYNDGNAVVAVGGNWELQPDYGFMFSEEVTWDFDTDGRTKVLVEGSEEPVYLYKVSPMVYSLYELQFAEYYFINAGSGSGVHLGHEYLKDRSNFSDCDSTGFAYLNHIVSASEGSYDLPNNSGHVEIPEDGTYFLAPDPESFTGVSSLFFDVVNPMSDKYTDCKIVHFYIGYDITMIASDYGAFRSVLDATSTGRVVVGTISQNPFGVVGEATCKYRYDSYEQINEFVFDFELFGVGLEEPSRAILRVVLKENDNIEVERYSNVYVPAPDPSADEGKILKVVDGVPTWVAE